MNRLTKYFLPIKAVQLPSKTVKTDKSGELSSKSQKLMLSLGLIQQSSNGCFYLLPFAQRSVDKLVSIINEEFSKLGALKIAMPSLTESSLWQKTGRFEDNVGELFEVKSRSDKPYLLSPTHEESVAHLLSLTPLLSYKRLPLLLYQISPKFRNERKPRFGLIRSKEFTMADLYSFDSSFEKAQETYSSVQICIRDLLKRLGLYYLEVKGDSGIMGGNLSHEFHIPNDIGDDTIQQCSICDYVANKNVCGDEFTCKQCNLKNLKESKGIEVAHTFLLGRKYSEALNANFKNSEGKACPFEMGSYGIGVTRLIGAVAESLSTDDCLKWPVSLAPFSVCIIPPKEGSEESGALANLVEKMYHSLEDIKKLAGDIILDDRTNFTIGRRLIEAKKLGFPYIIVIGKSATENVPKFEVHDTTKNECIYLELSAIIKYFSEKYSVDILPKSVFVNQFV